MKRLAIIDGDHVVWRAAGSCEPTKAKPYLESKEDAIARANQLMTGILYSLGDPDYELYISGSGNWRYSIDPEYKANRRDKRNPTWLQDVREHLVLTWRAELVNGMEVDDQCGIRMTQEEDAICVSLDKDLLQLPGKHYNFAKDLSQYISPLDGLRRFYKQIIEGDAADNVPSFDGKFRNYTPQKVQKLLDPIDEMTEEIEMYEYVKSIYDCDRNAKLLYVLRKEETLWQPPVKSDDEKQPE